MSSEVLSSTGATNANTSFSQERDSSSSTSISINNQSEMWKSNSNLSSTTQTADKNANSSDIRSISQELPEKRNSTISGDIEKSSVTQAISEATHVQSINDSDAGPKDYLKGSKSIKSSHSEDVKGLEAQNTSESTMRLTSEDTTLSSKNKVFNNIDNNSQSETVMNSTSKYSETFGKGLNNETHNLKLTTVLTSMSSEDATTEGKHTVSILNITLQSMGPQPAKNLPTSTSSIGIPTVNPASTIFSTNKKSSNSTITKREENDIKNTTQEFLINFTTGK